jgi:hypothetical protein
MRFIVRDALRRDLALFALHSQHCCCCCWFCDGALVFSIQDCVLSSVAANCSSLEKFNKRLKGVKGNEINLGVEFFIKAILNYKQT